MYQQVQDGIRRDVNQMESLIQLLNVSRHLERIVDLATNISEDVIYMIEGEIVRQKVEDYTNQPDEDDG
jgi:phosphate transport system protein